MGLSTSAVGARLRNDLRARRHPAWWAFWLHRVSGLLLAAFLPLHFWALGLALQGADALQGLLSWTDQPVVHMAEWGLVSLLALHMTGGIRLLLIEFGTWSGLRKDWIAVSLGAALAAGLAYALALLG
jgi:fumarate reductase subunit D